MCAAGAEDTLGLPIERGTLSASTSLEWLAGLGDRGRFCSGKPPGLAVSRLLRDQAGGQPVCWPLEDCCHTQQLEWERFVHTLTPRKLAPWGNPWQSPYRKITLLEWAAGLFSPAKKLHITLYMKHVTIPMDVDYP